MKITRILISGLLILLFIGGLWWWQADSPQSGYRISTIQLTAVDESTVAGFKTRLAELGYQAGDKLSYFSEGPAGSIDRLEGIIQRQLAHDPHLIMVSSTPATLAVKRLTADAPIPVVFAPVNDPVGAGIVNSLQAPGGHITGIRLPTGDDLRLQWLVKIVPGVKKVFVPYTANDKSALATLAQIRLVAPDLEVELLEQPVHNSEELDAVIAAIPAEADAVFLPRDSTVEARIEAFVAARPPRPVCAPSLTQVQAGALFSYGFVHREIGKQAARLAAQIFQGTPPAQLPVEMAENYLAINLKSAGMLGLSIPEQILLQTEYVIRE